jgi:uncharacterized protein (DUF2249 family)
MEIDIREVPEGDRLSKLLDAVSGLGQKEVLTLLCEEDPAPLMDSIKDIHGDSVDIQKMRWGRKDLLWMFHVKRSLKPSAYQSED